MVDFREMLEREKALGGVRIYNRRNHNTPKEARYVGRPTIFGNPFEVGVHGVQGECCYKFDMWLETGESFGNPNATEERRQSILAAIPSLRGLDLECWCWPKRCHAETLARRANNPALI